MTARTEASSIEETQALPLMRAEHAQLKALFSDYRRLTGNDGSAADRSAFVNRIAGRVQAIAALERELLLPLLPQDQVVSEAQQQLEQLLSQVDRLAACAPAAAADQGVAASAQDGQVRALAQAFEAHCRFDEERIFPPLEGRDLSAEGAALLQRRSELQQHETPD